MTSHQPLRIAIIGYGTAGQSAALFLSRDGHHVEVFEQTRTLGPVGAGFLLQPVGCRPAGSRTCGRSSRGGPPRVGGGAVPFCNAGVARVSRLRAAAGRERALPR